MYMSLPSEMIHPSRDLTSNHYKVWSGKYLRTEERNLNGLSIDYGVEGVACRVLLKKR